MELMNIKKRSSLFHLRLFGLAIESFWTQNIRAFVT